MLDYSINNIKGFVMDMCTVALIAGIIISFVVGLLLDVDSFAGGIFSGLKKSKDPHREDD